MTEIEFEQANVQQIRQERYSPEGMFLLFVYSKLDFGGYLLTGLIIITPNFLN